MDDLTVADIPVFVINLDRAPDRLAHAKAELAKHGLHFERVPAVDGDTLTSSEIAAAYDTDLSRRRYHVPMQRGEIACFLSHRLAWQTFLERSSAPFAMILEDDFRFVGPINPILEDVLFAKVEWDVIKLWAKPRRVSLKVASLFGAFHLAHERMVSKRTVGQLISRAGATKLLAGTQRISRPIDVQLQYPWELNLSMLTIAPSPLVDIGEQISGTSSAKNDTRRSFGAETLRREGRRVWLQLDRAISSFRYRR